MVQDDIMYHVLVFARDNGGVFKNSSFHFIADPPRTWPEKRDLLEHMVGLGFFEKYKNNRIYLYRITEKGRDYIGD